MLPGRLLLMILMLSTQLAAQNVITLPNPELYYDTKFTTKDLYLRRIDTSLENFHRYNPTANWEVPHIALSNLAQAPRPLRFSPDHYIGFRHGYHAFDRYFYTSDSVRYYNTRTPFTSAYYMNGAKEERAIHLVHAQNVNPNINLGFDYRRLVSESFFNRNKAGIHNFNLFQWYRSNNNKYNLMAAYVFNQVKAMENGGIAVEDIFTNPAYSRDFKTVPVRLQQADNRIDNSTLSIRQSLFLGPTYERKVDDSTFVETTRPRYGITHNMELRGVKVRYTDAVAGGGFYDNTFLNPESTDDSTRIRSFSNEFVFQNYLPKPDDSLFNPSDVAWRGGLRYVLHRWQQMGISEFRHGLQLFGGLQSNPYANANWRFSLDGALELAPRYAGDFLVEGKLLYAPGQLVQWEPFIKLNAQSPAYRWERSIGNHFQWENDFRKTFMAETGLRFRIPKWLLESSVSHQLVNNYLYVEENLQPTQADRALNVIRVYAAKNFSWKNFYLGHEVSAQWVSNDEIIRMPAVWFRQQFYYKGTYVKKKPIHAFFGFDLTYFSNHSGDAWNPAMMAFHVQRVNRQKYYPIVDVFFNLQIKRARLFFQMQHINQGLIWDGYFASPNYPMPPRALKLGVSWQFYD
jgi:hypothetical protein